jgi:hypothetical protein
MGQDSVATAIDRIERALARIEAAGGRARTASQGEDGEVSALRQSHRALRGRVESAIAQIDGLLAAGERG